MAGVAYLIYRKFADAGDSASKGIADAYVRVTAGPVIEVLPKIILPNGQKIDANGLAIKSDFTFVYGGKKYKLTKRRPDNDYDSVLAGVRW
jgi:hypothetical protein